MLHLVVVWNVWIKSIWKHSGGVKVKRIDETHLYILGRAEPRLPLEDFFPSGVFKKSCPMVAAADFLLSTSRWFTSCFQSFRLIAKNRKDSCLPFLFLAFFWHLEAFSPIAFAIYCICCTGFQGIHYSLFRNIDSESYYYRQRKFWCWIWQKNL